MKFYGVKFNRNKGNIILTLEHSTSAMLSMYALQNLNSREDMVVFREDGYIVDYFKGKKDDMPKICKDMRGLHINMICGGLLEAMNE